MQNILSILAIVFPSMYNCKLSKEEEIEVLIFLDNVWDTLIQKQNKTKKQTLSVAYLKFRFN